MSDEEYVSPLHPRPRQGKTARDRAHGHRRGPNIKDEGERGHLKGHKRPSWLKKISKAARAAR